MVAFKRLGGSPVLGRPGAPPMTLEGIRAIQDEIDEDSPGHEFWPDDASLSDTRFFPALPVSKHLTDLYLLGLAVKHGGRFATFDQSIDASLIPGGPAAFFLIKNEG